MPRASDQLSSRRSGTAPAQPPRTGTARHGGSAPSLPARPARGTRIAAAPGKLRGPTPHRRCGWPGGNARIVHLHAPAVGLPRSRSSVAPPPLLPVSPRSLPAGAGCPQPLAGISWPPLVRLRWPPVFSFAASARPSRLGFPARLCCALTARCHDGLGGRSLGTDPGPSPPLHRKRRRRSALVTTKTEDSAIAAAPSIGDRRGPPRGTSAPIATGISAAL